MSRPAATLLAVVALAGCHSSRPSPAAGAHPTTVVSQGGPFATLRSRAVHVPSTLPRGPECTQPAKPVARTIPGVNSEAALGVGPVYVENRGIPRIWWFAGRRRQTWRGDEVLWIADPRYRGPVLVRGGAVHSGRPLGFGTGATPKRELTVPASAWRHQGRGWGRPLHLRPGWRAAYATIRVKRRGCYFLQVDGNGFSETVTFFAVAG